jgi:hypothetical protein
MIERLELDPGLDLALVAGDFKKKASREGFNEFEIPSNQNLLCSSRFIVLQDIKARRVWKTPNSKRNTGKVDKHKKRNINRKDGLLSFKNKTEQNSYISEAEEAPTLVLSIKSLLFLTKNEGRTRNVANVLEIMG